MEPSENQYIPKEPTGEELQKKLENTALWLRKIIDEQFDADVHSEATFVSANTAENRVTGNSTWLAIYDLIDQYCIELSEHGAGHSTVSMTHYFLKQKAGGAWQLQTTGNLSEIEDENVLMDIESSDQSDNPFYGESQEPLYPNILRDATNEEIVKFSEAVELGAFGDTIFDFNELQSFLSDIQAIQNDAEDMDKNNPE
ncbi:MAG: hypothetical protein JWN28_897 [Candidatus Saccharibacteria bacterium]|nr:hypothetical protein [Candidatus Saccharibacteria bacterium]